MGDKLYYLSEGFSLVFKTFSLAYWTFTVPFYSLLIYAIIRAQRNNIPNLTSSFFKLCISAGLVDIVALLNSYFGGVFPTWGWFPDVYAKLGKPYAYVYLIIVWGSGINQAISVSMLAANRLSAIIFPYHHHQAWSGQRLKFAVAMQLVPGYTIALVILGNEVVLEKTLSGGLMPVFINKEVPNTYFAYASAFFTVNSVFLILSYCYLLYVIRKRHKAQLQAGVGTAVQHHITRELLMRRESQLFMIASAIVVVQLIFLLFMLVEVCPWIGFPTSLSYFLYNLFGNLYSSVSAYLLWIFSADLRHYVFMILRWKSRKQFVRPVLTLTVKP